jgi:hypothetical protein
MPMNYKQYQEEVSEDIAAVLSAASCQPILFVGSGFTKRYAKGPNWEELLRALATQCPRIDKDFAYYKQTYHGDLKRIGSIFSDLYRESAWAGGRIQFPDDYFREALDNRADPRDNSFVIAGGDWVHGRQAAWIR